MNELINKWSKTFLLEGIDKSKEAACAKTMEEVFQLCIRQSKDVKEKDSALNYEEFCMSIFPLIRRMYDRENFEVPVSSKIFDSFLEYYKKNYHTFKDICKYHAIDFESELLDFYFIFASNKSK